LNVNCCVKIVYDKVGLDINNLRDTRAR
jgi:hypothetical protein